MSSIVRRATAAGLLILSVALGVNEPASAWTRSSAPAHSSVPAPAPTAAQAAAGWLGRHFKGAAIRSKGKADVSSTALAVLAFAATGVGGTKANQAMAWLEDHFESYVSPGGVDDPGALATVILAAQSMGVDPTTFGGTGPANDLVTRLLNTQQTTGTDAGLFGSADPTYDGAFRQGLSLMALAEQGIANAAGVTWLQNQQCSDGGWEAYRTTPCTPPDPTDFTGPDTNSTSLAVEGLVAQEPLLAPGPVFPVDPTGFFESAQNPDGGFGYIGAATQSPDPDSTGEVIQALVALGALDNPAFTQEPSGATPLTALATFQLGCSAPKGQRGAYFYPGENGPNVLSTLQAAPGAAEVAFPISPQTPQPSLPKMKCSTH
jgi:hypothetical protein